MRFSNLCVFFGVHYYSTTVFTATYSTLRHPTSELVAAPVATPTVADKMPGLQAQF